MRALLVPVDVNPERLLAVKKGSSIFPNLALMKFSAVHKQRGDTVGFNVVNPDRVYVSCIFEKNLEQAKGLRLYYPGCEFYLGGPALNAPSVLPSDLPNVDLVMPDYGLYNLDYSMGFTTRGCIRRCPDCFVPNLEGDMSVAAPIEKFHHPDHKKIILLDNNFTASPTWEETLDYIEEQGLRVNFNQGLDLRLVTPAFAERLRPIKFYNWRFRARILNFAWDFMDSERQILRGLQRLSDAGIPRGYLQLYVLVGFDTTLAQDLYRIEKLRREKVDAYVMVYNDRQDAPILQKLKRWCNRKVLSRSHKFSEYRNLTPSQKSLAEAAEAQAEKMLAG